MRAACPAQRDEKDFALRPPDGPTEQALGTAAVTRAISGRTSLFWTRPAHLATTRPLALVVHCARTHVARPILDLLSARVDRRSMHVNDVSRFFCNFAVLEYLSVAELLNACVLFREKIKLLQKRMLLLFFIFVNKQICHYPFFINAII